MSANCLHAVHLRGRADHLGRWEFRSALGLGSEIEAVPTQ